MNFDTLYKKRPYLFEVGGDPFQDGGEIIYQICKHAELSRPLNVEFLASTYDYDAYKADIDGELYCIKYSLDKNNWNLKREYETLAFITVPVVPDARKYGEMKFGEDICYLIVSYECAENLKDYGVGVIHDSLENFIDDFSSLQKTSERPNANFNNYLSSTLSANSLKMFSKDDLEAIEAHTDVSAIRSVAAAIEVEIFSLAKPNIVRKNQLCHGNLKPSNILYRDGFFKFIDFNSSFCGNPYLDLAHLAISMGMKDHAQKELVSVYLKRNGQSLNPEEWVSYKSCYEIMLRITFLIILFSYLKEVYVFSSSNPKKIFDVIQLFARNDLAFAKISSVAAHYEFIYKSILEPVIGREEP